MQRSSRLDAQSPLPAALKTTWAAALTLAMLTGGGALGATLTVTSLADDGPGSLRQAVRTANASSGVADTIVFGVNGTITLASRLPDIDDDLTIDGTGAVVTLSGNQRAQLLFVAAGTRARIRGLTLADGFCASPCSGGAIVNVGCLDVEMSSFLGNSAVLGGAIHNFGRLRVWASAFTANSARFGGAIHNFDQLEVLGSSFNGNTAAHAGGAIYNFDRLTVVGSSFWGNRAATLGDDVHDPGGTANTVSLDFEPCS